MNLKIYEKKEADKKVFFLKLIPMGQSIVLAVVNEDGNPITGGRLLTISSDGVFHRATGIFDGVADMGLTLDGEYRVEIGANY